MDVSLAGIASILTAIGGMLGGMIAGVKLAKSAWESSIRRAVDERVAKDVIDAKNAEISELKEENAEKDERIRQLWSVINVLKRELEGSRSWQRSSKRSEIRGVRSVADAPSSARRLRRAKPSNGLSVKQRMLGQAQRRSQSDDTSKIDSSAHTST